MDAERLLGALLTRGLGGKKKRGRRTRRRGNLLSSMMGTTQRPQMAGTVGMGALGVAIAAYEHFTRSSGQAPSGPMSRRPSPPPPPPPKPVAPPPPPGGGPPPPPDSSPAAGPDATGQADAILLIRAMIAGAAADGEIDARERQLILDELDAAGLGAEEHEFVEKELASPPTFDQIVSAASRSPDLERQVYAASLAVIDVDTPSERGYLQMLAHRLGLDDAEVTALHARLGIE